MSESVVVSYIYGIALLCRTYMADLYMDTVLAPRGGDLNFRECGTLGLCSGACASINFVIRHQSLTRSLTGWLAH